MKKALLLIFAASAAMSVGAAPALTFTAGADVQETYAVGSGTLTVVNTNGKITIDANTSHFGTLDDYFTCDARMKTGGKSGASNNMTFTATEAGYLTIGVRTGSNSATDRTLVLTQGETEIYNKVVQEADAVEGDVKVYPLVTVQVAVGDVEIAYPVGSLNFYCFDFSTTDPNQGGGEEPVYGEVESYWAASYDAENNVGMAGPEWVANPESSEASVVTVGTASVTMEVVSGPVSQSIKLDESVPQDAEPVWITYYDNSWKVDKKNDWINENGEVEPHGFIQGFGNPTISANIEPYWQEEKSRWAVRTSYEYYEPDGSKGLPQNGTYIKLTASKDGAMSLWTYILKGNRPLMIVDEETAVALDTTKYYVEGCCNNHKNEAGDAMVYTRMYHGQTPITETNPETGALDTIGWKPNYVIMDAVQKANQHIWGWLKWNMEAGKTYWVFCTSTQIGFSGFEFAGVVGDGIEEVGEDAAERKNGVTYDIQGRRVDALVPGKLYIRDGKKILVR